MVGRDRPLSHCDRQGEVTVEASLTGLLRGIIKDGYPVVKGFKIAEIDPRKVI